LIVEFVYFIVGFLIARTYYKLHHKDCNYYEAVWKSLQSKYGNFILQGKTIDSEINRLRNIMSSIEREILEEREK
jgi:hypothetical protein